LDEHGEHLLLKCKAAKKLWHALNLDGCKMKGAELMDPRLLIEEILSIYAFCCVGAGGTHGINQL